MKIIVVSGQHGRSRTLSLGKKGLPLLLVSALLICCLSAGLAYEYARYQLPKEFANDSVASLKQELSTYESELTLLQVKSDQEVRALTLRLAQLQSRLVRLDALGELVAGIAKLDDGEFDFSQPPAIGGPETQDLGDTVDVSQALVSQGLVGGDLVARDLNVAIEDFRQRVNDREHQLEILENLLSTEQIEDAVYLEGRPIKKGWMSSGFGRRTDPFHGKMAWHKGVDFAGKAGSDVIAVASGIVTWSGERYSYGEMVEINHGGGYQTRYAHNAENLVKVGEVIKKGQIIAHMGSSGRSTGPHVHFEVFKHGKPVDPARYIYRKL